MKQPPSQPRSRFRRSRRRPLAFTLTELLISIAIALILILGINQIFKASSFTAGAGQALSSANRDNIVIKTTIADDIRNFASDGLLIIRSEQRYAYRNPSDKQADALGNVQQIQLPGSNNPIQVHQYETNNRSHRLDRLGFFDRGKFPRQTSPRNPVTPMLLTSGDTSNEAWIWYGHLALPNNAWLKNQGGGGDFYNPSSTAAGNDNNLFACDWVLGRIATLLAQAPAAPQGSDYLGGPPNGATSSTSPLDPLIYSSKTGDAQYKLYYAPTDMANVPGGISGYLTANTPPVANSFVGNNDWFDPMIGFDPLQVTSDPTNRKGEYWRTGSPFLQSPMNPGVGGVQGSRVTPFTASYLSFCMSRGCAQFIVEFAGDYLTQIDNPNNVNDGQVTQAADAAVHPDGKVDFYVEIDPVTGEHRHRIRWYGYPRWSGNTFKNGVPIMGTDSVLPLWELMPGQLPAPFERWGVGYSNTMARSGQDPNSPSYNYQDNWPAAQEPLAGFAPPAYTCAWSPSMKDMLPKMLRITIAIDDPNGRLASPQFYEYVLNLPQ